MKQLNLWEQLAFLKSDCEWIELSHSLSPVTPHWVGWPALKVEEQVNLDNSIFCAHAYTVVGQYGTHVDAPNHMVKGGRSLDQVGLSEMVYPLCVIDKSIEVSEDADYVLTVQDILDWESVNGTIPTGAFVAFQSNWSKRDPNTMDNLDSEGNRHFPAWHIDAIRFLTDERNVGAIGHETSDTESPLTSSDTNYAAEYLILEKDRIQIELLKNLDQCPATGAIIFCTFPQVVGGSGFPARCFAVCPK